MSLRALERGHRPREPISDELAVEDGAVVEDRQSSAETSELAGERLVAQPSPDVKGQHEPNAGGHEN